MLSLDFFQYGFGREMLICNPQLHGYRLSYAHGYLSAVWLREFEATFEKSFYGANLALGQLTGIGGKRRRALHSSLLKLGYADYLFERRRFSGSLFYHDRP